jgi:hypothetical protein
MRNENDLPGEREANSPAAFPEQASERDPG